MSTEILLEKNLKDLFKKNWVLRVTVGAPIICYAILVIYIGIPAILLNCLLIQVKCFNEIINIAYSSKRLPEIPHFRKLIWYFVFVANYFCYEETFTQHLDVLVKKYTVLEMSMKYHRFFSFCMYLAGFMWFLLRLRRSSIRQQFSILAWTHFLLIIIVLQSYMTVQTVFEGLIWFILPVTLVVLNDIFAYFWGKMLGKTPLIALSPKKTLEGFIGGGISTLLLGLLLSYVITQSQYFVCPARYIQVSDGIKLSTKCEPSYLFQPSNHNLLGMRITIKPFLWHSLAFSLFASIVAPFGGFCASGFKRAFKIKDFSDTIPGHGGIVDRFDCQFLMATFVNVYISTFIRPYTVKRIYEKVLNLREDQQLELYFMLENFLKSEGISEVS